MSLSSSFNSTGWSNVGLFWLFLCCGFAVSIFVRLFLFLRHSFILRWHFWLLSLDYRSHRSGCCFLTFSNIQLNLIHLKLYNYYFNIFAEFIHNVANFVHNSIVCLRTTIFENVEETCFHNEQPKFIWKWRKNYLNIENNKLTKIFRKIWNAHRFLGFEKFE